MRLNIEGTEDKFFLELLCPNMSDKGDYLRN